MRRPLVYALIASIVFLSGCTYRWIAQPKNVAAEMRCNPLQSYPQMLNVPGFKNAWILVSDCSAYHPERVSVAMSIFMNMWEARFGRSSLVRSNINTILIEWNTDKKGGAAYSADGQYISSASFSGLTLTKGTIWVKVKNQPGRICETSMVHELVHASIWALKNTDGDADHLGHKYHGWTTRHSMLIQDVNQLLCRLGI